jgi:quercetin dioxygenase-like cupin family protein
MSIDRTTADPADGIVRKYLVSGDITGKPDRVEIYEVTLEPGQATGRHFHPGGVAGYLRSGRVVFQREGHPAQELVAGSGFFEPAGETILRFDNTSTTEPATFIGCYTLADDQPLIQAL